MQSEGDDVCEEWFERSSLRGGSMKRFLVGITLYPTSWAADRLLGADGTMEASTRLSAPSLLWKARNTGSIAARPANTCPHGRRYAVP